MIFRRGQWAVVATLAAIALAGMALQPATMLVVETVDGHAVLACERIDPATPVTLVFTHSMFGGEVREMWRAEGSTLVRTGFETENAAAAEYYAWDGKVERISDGFALDLPPLRTNALSIRVDQVGRHRLRFGGEEISMADQVDGSAAVTMSVEQVPLIAWWLRDDCGGLGA